MPRVGSVEEPLTPASILRSGQQIALRCCDCEHEYMAAKVEYLCPECHGDVGIAPMGQQRVALA